MSQSAMLKHITARVKQMFGASAYSAVPVAYPNQPFVQPDNAPFVALRLKEGDSFPTTMGTAVNDRCTGVVQMDVYVPVESGTLLGLQIGEFCKTIFRRYSVTLDDNSKLYFRIPNISYIGDQNGRAAFCVKVDYYRDEVAS